MDWEAIDNEPITQALIGSLVDEELPPLTGMVAAGQLGGLTRLIATATVEAADYLWGLQRDRGEALWSVPQVLARLGFPRAAGAAIVAHVVAELEHRRQHWERCTSPGTLTEGVKRALRLRPGAPRRRPPVEELPCASHEFRRQGEMWVVTFAGEKTFLKAGLGPAYIAYLLASPRKSISALDLHTAASGRKVRPRMGSAGERADVKARSDVRERCRELQEELAEARRNCDEGREELLLAEVEKLAGYLAEVEGLGGRGRRASDDADRIRRSVFQAIRRTIRALEQHLPDAARHLDGAVRTGLFVSYEPEEDLPWAL